MKHKNLYKRFGVDILAIVKAEQQRMFSEMMSFMRLSEDISLYWMAYVKDDSAMTHMLNYVKKHNDVYSDVHSIAIRLDDSPMFIVAFSYRDGCDCWNTRNINEEEILHNFNDVDGVKFMVPYFKGGISGWCVFLKPIEKRNTPISDIIDFLFENYGLVASINKENLICGHLAE